MPGIKQVRLIQVVFAAAVLLLMGVVPLFFNTYLLTVSVIGLVLVYLCLCWNLAAGYAGQFSLGHSVYFGTGAYFSTLLFLKLGISPWIGMFIGGAAGALTAAAISALAYRCSLKGIYFALVTMASFEVFKGVADNIEFIGGSQGLLLPLTDSPGNFLFLSRIPYYYIIIAMVILMIVLTICLERSTFGYRLKAIREDEEAAAATGINTDKNKIVIMAISGFFTAIAGTFYAQFFLFASPGNLFSFDHQMNMMLGTMVGGAGTVLGPIVGSAFFTVIGEFLRSASPIDSHQAAAVTKMIYAALLMVSLIYLPGGLVSLNGRKLLKKPKPKGSLLKPKVGSDEKC